jgi:Flp pilus assembly protein TadD
MSKMSGRRAIVVVLGALLWGGAASPVAAQPRAEARSLVSFGIQVAERGLWREAIYRWQRAIEIDPTYAAAFNNLGIGYEREGELDKAREAYEKAISLAPKDPQIRQNYELFKEINERVTAPPKDQP